MKCKFLEVKLLCNSLCHSLTDWLINSLNNSIELSLQSNTFFPLILILNRCSDSIIIWWYSILDLMIFLTGWERQDPIGRQIHKIFEQSWVSLQPWFCQNGNFHQDLWNYRSLFFLTIVKKSFLKKHLTSLH